MTDRELLEAAAKAAGIELQRSRLDDQMWCDMLLKVRDPRNDGKGVGWNPLTDDGDALRLAVKLRLHVGYSGGNQYFAVPSTSDKHCMRESGERPTGTQDECAATRRAIVRAAAAMAPKQP